MSQETPMFCVDVLIGSDEEEREVTLYVRATDSDSLNDITRNYEGVSFCPVAEGAVPDDKVDYNLPKDHIELINHLRQLTQGF